ncbi:retrovirus-related pol polyprotein from transposon TNT 1-94 [Tanacetum coccineum]
MGSATKPKKPDTYMELVPKRTIGYLSIKKTTTMHEKTTSPRSCLRWQPTGRILKTVCLRWVPTGKTFASSTTKVESEPPNGSNADIPNQCESEHALNVSAGTFLSTGTSFTPRAAADQASVFMVMTFEHSSSDLAPQRLMVSAENNTSGPVPQCSNDVCSHQFRPPEKTDSSHQGLEFLFSPLLEEYYNPTHDQAEENNNDQAPNASFQEAEFINPFCTRVQEIVREAMLIRAWIRSNADETSSVLQTKSLGTSRQNHEEGYVAQPEGFIDLDHPEKVYLLRKALYGLKQAPREWYDELSNFLMSKGFSKGLREGYELTSLSDAEHADCLDTRKALLRDTVPSSALSTNQFGGETKLGGASRGGTLYHFIKEHVENGIIELYFVRTEYQLADMFTKALPEDRFKYLVRRIGMRCLTPAELEVLTNESA